MSDSRAPAAEGAEERESGGLGGKKIDDGDEFGLNEREGKLWRRRRENGGKRWWWLRGGRVEERKERASCCIVQETSLTT